MNDFNAQVIADFNAKGGKPGGYLGDDPVVLLHVIGAKSAQERTQPLMYLEGENETWYIFASYAGRDNNPAWYHNLRANPEAAISIGDGTTIERVPVLARELQGEQRDAIYAEMARRHQRFADYQSKTDRKIPVIELTRR